MSSLSNIKHIIVVLSGKGGVGKSSVSLQLALSLTLASYSVTLLDIDLTGPSIPRMLSLESARVTQAPGGWLPVPVYEANPAKNTGKLSAMSLGFLLQSRGEAVVWRGPKKTAMVRQFLTDVLWEPGTDFLIIDTPPGTGDEQISLVETLHRLTADDPARLAGAVVVTTPQQVSVADVRKELNFCAKTSLEVLGVVENMSGYNCEFCPGCWDPFNAEVDEDGNIKQKNGGKEGGGKAMANEFRVPFLGEVPLDPQFVMLVETGRTPVRREWKAMEGGGPKDGEWVEIQDEGDQPTGLADKYSKCSLSERFAKMTDKLLEGLNR